MMASNLHYESPRKAAIGDGNPKVSTVFWRFFQDSLKTRRSLPIEDHQGRGGAKRPARVAAKCQEIANPIRADS
jgi:hypothetical protein